MNFSLNFFSYIKNDKKEGIPDKIFQKFSFFLLFMP